MGILRVVEEIISKRPDATVVINSLFPMAELRGAPGGKIMGLDESFGARPGKINHNGNNQQVNNLGNIQNENTNGNGNNQNNNNPKQKIDNNSNHNNNNN